VRSLRRCIVTILFLASIYSILYSSAVLSFSAVSQNEDSGFLKFEINDVYVGNLTHTIEISNLNSTARVSGGKLFVPLVRNATARHYAILYDVYASSGVQPKNISEDNSGNTYAYWDNIEIDGNKAFSVKISYYVLSFDTRYVVNSSLVASYNESSDLYKKYTEPEELIQSTHPSIVSKAENLTSDENSSHGKVSKIYNFVITHMRYVFQEEERGALWALINRTGDCSEYSYLFVALCRAAGIPARVQTGFAFRSPSETIEDGHMWAEYYLENYGWMPVDATWRLFDALDNRHFSSIQGIPEVIPYANYGFNHTTGPEPTDEQKVSVKPCSTNVFDGNSFAENITKTVSEVKRAKFAVFLGKVFGTSLIFPSEAKKVEQEFLESKIYLQNAIEFWDRQPQLVQSSITAALDFAEAALENAWLLIAKVLCLILSVLIAILLIALVLLRRYQVKQVTQAAQL